MYVFFVVCGVLSLSFMVGLFYRWTSWILFFGFTYWFLLDQTRYLNHFYFTSLLCFLMALIPAHAAKSVDNKINPKTQSNTVPTWCLWVLRAQIGIVYFYGGIAKLNADWLQAEPIRKWLHDRGDYPLIGSFLETEFAAYFYAYGGLLFDLLIVPALLWKRTRALALVACLFFHFSNAMMFKIGIFPPMMMCATLLYCNPDWPRRICLLFKPLRKKETNLPPKKLSEFYKRTLAAILTVYLAIQVFIPFRHFAYPGSVHWTDEGHFFAWHMMLRSKRAKTTFYAFDPASGKRWKLDHRQYLSDMQRDRVGRFPDFTLQMAHFLEKEERKKGYGDIEIYVDTRVSLNGRPYQQIIDPTVDLTQLERGLMPKEWIIPLEHPLPKKEREMLAKPSFLAESKRITDE